MCAFVYMYLWMCVSFISPTELSELNEFLSAVGGAEDAEDDGILLCCSFHYLFCFAFFWCLFYFWFHCLLIFCYLFAGCCCLLIKYPTLLSSSFIFLFVFHHTIHISSLSHFLTFLFTFLLEFFLSFFHTQRSLHFLQRHHRSIWHERCASISSSCVEWVRWEGKFSKPRWNFSHIMYAVVFFI